MTSVRMNGIQHVAPATSLFQETARILWSILIVNTADISTHAAAQKHGNLFL